MVRWLLAGAGALVALVALFSATLLVSSEVRRVHHGVEAEQSLLTTPRPGYTGTTTWNVTRAMVAHNVLVVEVAARDVDEARTIAEEIVKPVLSRGYHEVLVYVQQTGITGGEMRRIQWTPKGGYAEATYAPIR